MNRSQKGRSFGVRMGSRALPGDMYCIGAGSLGDVWLVISIYVHADKSHCNYELVVMPDGTWWFGPSGSMRHSAVRTHVVRPNLSAGGRAK